VADPLQEISRRAADRVAIVSLDELADPGDHGVGESRGLGRILPGRTDPDRELLHAARVVALQIGLHARCERRERLELPWHQRLVAGELPPSIGGGIGQSRTYMLLLRKAHLGEVSVTVWPEILKRISREKNIHVLE